MDTHMRRDTLAVTQTEARKSRAAKAATRIRTPQLPALSPWNRPLWTQTYREMKI